jgi:hypothetical protein
MPGWSGWSASRWVETAPWSLRADGRPAAWWGCLAVVMVVGALCGVAFALALIRLFPSTCSWCSRSPSPPLSPRGALSRRCHRRPARPRLQEAKEEPPAQPCYPGDEPTHAPLVHAGRTWSKAQKKRRRRKHTGKRLGATSGVNALVPHPYTSNRNGQDGKQRGESNNMVAKSAAVPKAAARVPVKTLGELPEEVVLCVLRRLSMRDLSTVSQAPTTLPRRCGQECSFH